MTITALNPANAADGLSRGFKCGVGRVKGCKPKLARGPALIAAVGFAVLMSMTGCTEGHDTHAQANLPAPPAVDAMELPPGHPRLDETPAAAGGDKGSAHGVRSADHRLVGQGGTAGFGHPKTGSPLTVKIPDDVKAKWKSVELSITPKGKKEKSVRVGIGDQIALNNSGLVMHVIAYLPSYQSGAGIITSASSKPENPAVLLQLLNKQGIIVKGWVFQDLPDFNTFSSDRVQVKLLSALPSEAKK